MSSLRRWKSGSIALAAALVLSGFLAMSAIAIGPFDFAQPASSPEAVGGGPSAIVAADLDGDTDQDLAVADNLVGQVTVLRNAGTGNFSEPATSPEAVGASPSSIAAADFDGDADIDLAVTSADNNTDNVIILRNTGGADFNQPTSSPEDAGLAPSGIVAADFDGDSDVDLAVANFQSASVTILRNAGNGNFAEPASSPVAVGGFPAAIVVADLDGDSDQDLAVADNGPDDVSVLTNNGSGKFTKPASSPEPVGADPISLTAGDLDGDGDADLAVVNLGANVSILKNVGGADFVQPASSPEPAGASPFAIAAADIDGDSKLDLAVANNTSNSVTILRHVAGVNFSEPTSSPESTGLTPSALVFSDLDGDTDQDIATANRNANNVTFLRNR